MMWRTFRLSMMLTGPRRDRLGLDLFFLNRHWSAAMPLPNDNPRVTGNKRRNKSVGWAIAGVVVLLISLLVPAPQPPK